jgi:hypothetical protein
MGRVRIVVEAMGNVFPKLKILGFAKRIHFFFTYFGTLNLV